MMNALKTGYLAHSRFAKISQSVDADDDVPAPKYGEKFERSGGGVWLADPPANGVTRLPTWDPKVDERAAAS